jgi:hypothetical protein
MGAIMSRNNVSKPNAARKPASRARPANKRSRRVIFKADEWYAGAALSIGIAGRSKGSRPMQLFAPRGEDKAD